MNEEAKKRLRDKLMEAQGDRSQREFARNLGVALGTLQIWLRGDSLPMIDKFEKLASALGMSQEALFSYVVSGDRGKGNFPPATPTKAEDVRLYASALPVEEKIRLLSMIGEDIALDSQGDGDR